MGYERYFIHERDPTTASGIVLGGAFSFTTGAQRLTVEGFNP